MANHDVNMILERYAQEYANDPEFIAEGLSIKVIEEMLQCLEQRKLSQTWLAQKMGVSRAHVSRILNAPPNMTLLTIAKIAVALGVTPDVCVNAQSWRSREAPAVVANAIETGSPIVAYLSEVEHRLGARREYWLSTAGSVPVATAASIAAAA